jgi:D-proline reductase (dithiol) PrdB
VQRVIEAAGIATICVNMIPGLSHAYGFPRVAALEFPFSMPLGRPDDRAGQLQVIRAALQALTTMTEPGSVVHLPFEWSDDPVALQSHPTEPAPLGKALLQRKIANPTTVMGQEHWPDVAAILNAGRRLSS